jgi:hypothetical protein
MDEDDFDSEDDAMPADMLCFKREVTAPDGQEVVIEASITKHGDDQGVTWIKFYNRGLPQNFSHCFVDTMDAELILSAVENYVRDGKGPEVAAFLKEEGRVAMSPVVFRLKLDTALGGGSQARDAGSVF